MRKIIELWFKFENFMDEVILWLQEWYDFAFGSGIRMIGVYMWDDFFVETILLFTTLLLTVTVGILAILQEKEKKKKKKKRIQDLQDYLKKKK
jgi:hypothetical protein